MFILGKVLLERLLSAVTGSGLIYVLLRPSRKQPDIRQRLASILAGPVFSRVRERVPNFSERFVAVAGDVSHDMLGMRDDERDIVCRCCSVVVHCAATVKFHEHLLDAIQVVQLLKLTNNALSSSLSFDSLSFRSMSKVYAESCSSAGKCSPLHPLATSLICLSQTHEQLCFAGPRVHRFCTCL